MSITNEQAVEILRIMNHDFDADHDDESCAVLLGASALLEVERLRAEIAELRKPVEVLPMEVEHELMLVFTGELEHLSQLDDLRAAILKFKNGAT